MEYARAFASKRCIFLQPNHRLVMNHRPNLHCSALTSLDCNFYYSNLRLYIRTQCEDQDTFEAAFAQKNIQNEAKFTNAFNEPRSNWPKRRRCIRGNKTQWGRLNKA